MYRKLKTIAFASIASLLSAMPAHAAALFDFSFTAPLSNGDTASGAGRIMTDDVDAAGRYLLRSITGSISLYEGDTMFRPIDSATGTGGSLRPIFLGVPGGGSPDPGSLYRDANGILVTDGLMIRAGGAMTTIGFTVRRNGVYDGFATEVGIRGATLSFAQRVSAVPEPASWAMLVTGFGAIGFALRRRPAPGVRYA